MRIAAFLLIAMICASVIRAQSPAPGLTPAYAEQEDCARPTVRMPLRPDAVPDNLEARAHAALNRIQHPQTRKEVEGERSGLRDKLKRSLGYNLLPWPPDLRATITGTVQREGYRIEKIAFQTLPNVMMTAHLYVPEAMTSPSPAVLFWSGHSAAEGKLDADAQRFAVTMARRGFVVLVADSTGTGERIADSKIHHPEALLVGLSESGIDEYETRCALEFLASRKDVDPDRIGITGVDDAGFNTWLAAALEDRVAAAVPVDSTYDFGDRIRQMRAVDWDGANHQSDLVPGILKFANIQELIAMAAPRGVMIIDGPRAHGIYDYATQIYGSFGDNSRVRLFENSEGTGYDKPRRQAAYGFFLRVLKGAGDGAPVDEPAVEVSPANAPELQCLPKGSQLSASTGISEMVHRLAIAAESRTPRESVDSVAGAVPAGAKLSLCLNGVPRTLENFVAERGVSIPATVLRPGFRNSGGARGWLVAIDDEKKESLESDPVVQEAMRRDYLVWELDPRGFGELPVLQPSWQFATGLLLGDNLVWRQAWDIHALVDSFCTDTRKSIGLYARGPNSSLAAAYAINLLSSSCLDWAVLKGGYVSLRQLLDMLAVMKGPVAGQSVLYDDFAFGALEAPDLPQLLAPAKARTFLIDPIDPQRARATQSDRVRVTTTEQFISADW